MIRSTKGFKKVWEVELQAEKQILRKKKKKKGEKMKLIEKCDCDEFTNGGACKAKRDPETGLYEACLFAKIKGWKEECKDKSIGGAIKFLQDEIMNLGFFKMNSCLKRIRTKWKNHDENEERISQIRKKVNKKIDKINREIKALTEKKKKKKNKFSPQLK